MTGFKSNTRAGCSFVDRPGLFKAVTELCQHPRLVVVAIRTIAALASILGAIGLFGLRPRAKIVRILRDLSLIGGRITSGAMTGFKSNTRAGCGFVDRPSLFKAVTELFQNTRLVVIAIRAIAALTSILGAIGLLGLRPCTKVVRELCDLALIGGRIAGGTMTGFKPNSRAGCGFVDRPSLFKAVTKLWKDLCLRIRAMRACTRLNTVVGTVRCGLDDPIQHCMSRHGNLGIAIGMLTYGAYVFGIALGGTRGRYHGRLITVSRLLNGLTFQKHVAIHAGAMSCAVMRTIRRQIDDPFAGYVLGLCNGGIYVGVTAMCAYVRSKALCSTSGRCYGILIAVPLCRDNKSLGADLLGAIDVRVVRIADLAVPILTVAAVLAGRCLCSMIERGVLMLGNKVRIGGTYPFGVDHYQPHVLSLHRLRQVKNALCSISFNGNAVGIPLELQLCHALGIICKRKFGKIRLKIHTNGRNALDGKFINTAVIRKQCAILGGSCGIDGAKHVGNAVSVCIPAANDQTAEDTRRRAQSIPFGKGAYHLLRVGKNPGNLIGSGSFILLILRGVADHRFIIHHLSASTGLLTVECIAPANKGVSCLLRNDGGSNVGIGSSNHLKQRAVGIEPLVSVGNDHLGDLQGYTTDQIVADQNLKGVGACLKLLQLFGKKGYGLQIVSNLLYRIEAFIECFPIHSEKNVRDRTQLILTDNGIHSKIGNGRDLYVKLSAVLEEQIGINADLRSNGICILNGLINSLGNFGEVDCRQVVRKELLGLIFTCLYVNADHTVSVCKNAVVQRQLIVQNAAGFHRLPCLNRADVYLLGKKRLQSIIIHTNLRILRVTHRAVEYVELQGIGSGKIAAIANCDHQRILFANNHLLDVRSHIHVRRADALGIPFGECE